MNYPLFDMYGRNTYQAPQQMFPQQNMYQPQNQFLVRQVSNIEEAKACLVDPLSTTLFVDFSAGKIYMKRMNNNGLSEFYTFAVEENIQEAKKSDPLVMINERLTNIENKLGGNYDKSISNDGAKSDEHGSKSTGSADAKTES